MFSRLAENGLPVFFFFQAEDGIRDLIVTGVQTCALPISPLATPAQDMILGSYYLTYGPDEDELNGKDRGKLQPHVYRTAQEAELAYENGVVKLHDIAEFRAPGRAGGHILTTVGRIIFNDKIERALEAALGEDEFDPSQYAFLNKALRKRDTT